MNRSIKIILLLPLLLLPGACGDDAPSMGDEGIEAEIPVTSPTFNIINILQATGNDVKVTSRTKRSLFPDTKGYSVTVNGGVNLELYEFESEEELNSAVATISPDASTIGGKKVEWEASPHLYKTDKVIIIYLGDDPDNKSQIGQTFGGQFAGRP